MDAVTPNAAAQRALFKLLYRADCPPSLELGEYRLGLLDKPHQTALATHLSECPHCSEELARLDGYLAGLQPQEVAARGLTERLADGVRVLIAELLGGPRHVLTVRGNAEAEFGPILYSAGEIQIALDPQPDPEQPNAQSLLGLITGADTAGWQAHLWRSNQQLATTPIDDTGSFNFDQLTSGDYQIIANGNGVEVHVTVAL